MADGITCPKCGKRIAGSKVSRAFQSTTQKQLRCTCGTNIDISGAKRELQKQTKQIEREVKREFDKLKRKFKL